MTLRDHRRFLAQDHAGNTEDSYSGSYMTLRDHTRFLAQDHT